MQLKLASCWEIWTQAWNIMASAFFDNDSSITDAPFLGSAKSPVFFFFNRQMGLMVCLISRTLTIPHFFAFWGDCEFFCVFEIKWCSIIFILYRFVQFSGRSVMENSREDDPTWFLGSVNYLRSVINELEVANFCLPEFTLVYITGFAVQAYSPLNKNCNKGITKNLCNRPNSSHLFISEFNCVSVMQREINSLNAAISWEKG